LKQRLTDSIVKQLPGPDVRSGKKTRCRVCYDEEVPGFGVQINASDGRSFILNYSFYGHERRMTIGSVKDWKASAARVEAKRLRRLIDIGIDPMAEIDAKRRAPTVEALCARYLEEHLPKKRPNAAFDDRSMIERDILPVLKHRRVAEVSFSDVDALHRAITKRAPYRANRVIALLSKMFSLAAKWGWRSENPCKGVERNPENRRQLFLTHAEIERLWAWLDSHEDRQAASIIKLLLLTGARSGEVESMRWFDLDLDEGLWTKPSTITKQAREHRVPLSPPAVALLRDLKLRVFPSEYVFPLKGGYRKDIRPTWRQVRDVLGRPELRVHDLRHTYASILASSGLSLPVIGALLGHTQAATTQRYSHLFDEALRKATEQVAEVVQQKRDDVAISAGAG
jgi:integrase